MRNRNGGFWFGGLRALQQVWSGVGLARSGMARMSLVDLPLVPGPVVCYSRQRDNCEDVGERCEK